MAEGEEDFTFPTTTANLPPCFFESPPLWQPPPRLENLESLEYDEVEEEVRKLELCSCEECRAKIINNFNTLTESFCNDDSDDKEEKMDLLWEDLDEKCSRNCGKMAEDKSEDSSPGRNVKICCVKTLKLSKANGQSMNGLKASILVLIRFLMKKGFSMHNSGNSIKKLAW